MRAGLLPLHSVLVLLFAAGCRQGVVAETPAPAAPPSPALAPAPVPVPEPAPIEVAQMQGARIAPEAPPLAPSGSKSAIQKKAVTPTTATSEPSTLAAVPTATTPGTATEPAKVATAVDYALDPAKSALYVQVYKNADTVAAGLSHDHVVAATGWNGTVHWDPDDPSTCKMQITVPVSGLRPDDDGMRKRVGYDVMLENKQREKIKGHMLAAGQLDAKRFGEVRFASTRCEATDDKVKVSGKLTLHGVSKPVTSTMKISGNGTSLTAFGTFSAKATDFGFEPYSALLGALKNKNEMKFTVDVQGVSK